MVFTRYYRKRRTLTDNVPKFLHTVTAALSVRTLPSPVCEIGKYFWGSLILRRVGAHAQGSRVLDYGPTPDPLSLYHDDINLIATCFNVVFKLVFKKAFLFLPCDCM